MKQRGEDRMSERARDSLLADKRSSFLVSFLPKGQQRAHKDQTIKGADSEI